MLLHRRIGLVGQEPVLFSGTIGENIRMGRKEGVSTEEMLKSSEMANAAEFISKVRTVMYCNLLISRVIPKINFWKYEALIQNCAYLNQLC